MPLAAFRWFTPNEAFPVDVPAGQDGPPRRHRGQGRGDPAGGRRSSSGSPCSRSSRSGSTASGGSTPLRLRVAGDPDSYVFAKLYAKSHVRADRWYKLGRTILYGSLEDETSFQTVRRFVQYEDYTLRLMQDVGAPGARAVRDRRDHARSAST